MRAGKRTDGNPQRVPTGVSGLDDILGGGLAPGRFYAIAGNPGTGKTTLGLHFALAGARRAEPCLFVSLSESEEELKAAAASHGWALDGVHLMGIMPADRDIGDARYTMFHPSEVELGETTRRILQQVEELQPTRIVLDSLSELRLMSDDPLNYRRQILALKRFFSSQRATTLLLDDRLGERSNMQLYSLAHGLIELEREDPGYGSTRRRLRIAKIRAQEYLGGWHDYLIRKGGIALFPRLAKSVTKETPRESHESVSTGLEALDTLLGGGLRRGENALIVGPAGAGKSTVATRITRAASDRGERVSWFLFDESATTLLQRASGLSMDLNQHMQRGLHTIRQIDPAELTPGEFADAVRRAVEEHGHSFIVIDSLSGYLHAMANDRHLMLHLHELLAYLGKRGVTTLMIMPHHGVLGEFRGIDTSYIADTVIQLRFFEAFGEVRQAISVIKKRTGIHERTIRELRFGGEHGIRIGAPLREFHGVLGGSPTFIGETLQSEDQ